MPVEAIETFTVVGVQAVDADILEVAVGAHAFHVERLTLDGARPFEHVRSVCVPTAIAFASSFVNPDQTQGDPCGHRLATPDLIELLQRLAETQNDVLDAVATRWATRSRPAASSTFSGAAIPSSRRSTRFRATAASSACTR